MNVPENLCISCMRSIPHDTEMHCPYCGFNGKSYQAQEGLLKPATLFENRYHVGAAYLREKIFTSGSSDTTFASYSAYDTIMRRRVVLRVFREKSTGFEHYTRCGRFTDTFKRLALLGIASYPAVYTCKTFDGGAYAVCEYVSDTTFTHEIAQRGRTGFEEAKALLLPVIVTLKLMHDERLIHGCVCADAVRRRGKDITLCDASTAACEKTAADDVRDFLRLLVAVMYGSISPVPREFITGTFLARNENKLPDDALQCIRSAFDGGMEVTSEEVLRSVYRCGSIELGMKKKVPSTPGWLIKYARVEGVKIKGLITSLS